MAPYTPPAVWKFVPTEAPFSQVNAPTSGARFDAKLPVGKEALQLYNMGLSPNGQKVTILLEELIDAGKLENYDAWLVDVFKGEQFGSGFVAANPNSKIPVLVDHADPSSPLHVFESGNILLYLADKYRSFVPAADDVRGRTELLNWLFWQVGNAPYLGQFGHFYAFHDTKMQYPIDRYSMETKRLLDVLDKHLATQAQTGGFVAGAYSIADMALWPWFGGLVLGRVYAPNSDTFLNAAQYTHVLDWARRIDARPAVQRGRIVNLNKGPLHEQLPERHHPSDFERTQDKARDANSQL